MYVLEELLINIYLLVIVVSIHTSIHTYIHIVIICHRVETGSGQSTSPGQMGNLSSGDQAKLKKSGLTRVCITL